MTADYREWRTSLNRLDELLAELKILAARVNLPSFDQEECLALLKYKLLPQIAADPVLIVAVVGGTNIGKSLIFNQLAGESASAVSPLAAGTRHPVCLISPQGVNAARLNDWFSSFAVLAWKNSQDALIDAPEHRLYWRIGDHVPSRLLLLDTPDIDSDAVVNWQRADVIRQSADVLIAVLTQQKYNDAAVKRFFRLAAEAQKPMIIIFNQCDLVEDRPYWSHWLSTFVSETGSDPLSVFVVPLDREAAKKLSLPMFQVGQELQGELLPASLPDQLATLRFDEIKIRTYRGAMKRILDHQHGVPAIVRRVKHAALEHQEALAALSQACATQVHWPSLPAAALVEEIRQWWDAHRAGWSRKVHGFYRAVGRRVMWPIRKSLQAMGAQHASATATIQDRELDAIVHSVERLFSELERIARVGNSTLRPLIQKLLSGKNREKLLQELRTLHAQRPLMEDTLRNEMWSELDLWGEQYPRAVSFLRSLDHVAAIARPAISVTLALSGWMIAGDVMGHAVAHVAGHTAGQLATEAAITASVAGGGEAVVSATVEGVQQAAARLLRRLQERYVQSRAKWLTTFLEDQFLGPVLGELKQGSDLAIHPAILEIEALMESLSRQV